MTVYEYCTESHEERIERELAFLASILGPAESHEERIERLLQDGGRATQVARESHEERIERYHVDLEDRLGLGPRNLMRRELKASSPSSSWPRSSRSESHEERIERALPVMVVA